MGREERRKKGTRKEGKGGGSKGRREEKVLICFLSKASLQMWRILDDIIEKKGITARAQKSRAQ